MGASEDSVPISELADMVTCERKTFLQVRHGRRTTRQREEAKSRGNALHDAAFRQTRPDQPTQARDQRCFIATAIYGEQAAQTEHLRRFRDEKLMRSRGGRWAVRVYYSVSPWMVRRLAGRRKMTALARYLLDLAVKITGWRK